MNTTEKAAHNYLLNVGYEKNEIRYQNNKSPDFITDDKIGWEVKPKPKDNDYRNTFSLPQLNMPLDTMILFVDTNSYEIEQLTFGDCKKKYNITPEYSQEKKYVLFESKGQLKVTLPKVLAQNFKLRKDDRIKWEKYGDNLMIVKV